MLGKKYAPVWLSMASWVVSSEGISRIKAALGLPMPKNVRSAVNTVLYAVCARVITLLFGWL